MRNAIVIFFCVLTATLPLRADVGYSAGVTQADAMIEQGDFKGAESLLKSKLADKSLSADARKKVEFQIDWLGRERLDFPSTKDQLFKKISKSMPDVKREEFDKWVADGWFDSRKIDGVEYYVTTSLSNLYFRHPELMPRRKDGKNSASRQKGMLTAAREIKKATLAEHTPYVLPFHLKDTLSATVDKGAAPAGETIRAWLPVPRANDHQRDIKVLDSSSPILSLAPETSPIRSAYMEQKADGKNAAAFKVSYSYTSYGVHFDLDPAKAQAADLSNPELKKYTSEQAHVIFNDRIKKLANDIAGKETNPVVKAKAYFDWISSNIKYSYAREYSTLTNISDYTACNGYGDCGQEGMLFITLCRSAGIPARWQTGWDIYPDDFDIHDWTEIYIAPYGWVPCDPWAAIFAKQYCTALTTAERIELRDFYFGGLDQWRMIANSDHSQPLAPTKNSARSDDIDFQRGEFEWGNHNIYYNDFNYKMKVEKLKVDVQ